MKKQAYYLLVLSIFLLANATLRYGEYETGVHEQVHPKLYRLENQDYLKNDWYTNSVSQFDARTYYLKSIMFLSLITGSIQSIEFIIYIIIYLLLYLSLYYLALYFVENHEKSFLITTISYIAISLSLDETDLTKLILTPATIGWSFVIIALNLHLRKKNSLAFLMVGISSLIQPVMGTIGYALIIGRIFLSKAYLWKEKVKALGKSLIFYAFYALTIIPLVLSNIKTSNKEESIYSSEIIGWFAHAGHIVPSTWSVLKYATFILLGIVFLISLSEYRLPKEKKNIVYQWMIVIGMICFVGYFFVEVITFSPVVKMQLFRATIIFNIMEYIFIGNYIYTKIKNSTNPLEKTFYGAFPLTLISPITLFCGSLLFIAHEFVSRKLKKDILKILWREKILFLWVGSLAIIAGTVLIRNMNLAITSFLPSFFHTALAYIFLPVILYCCSFSFIQHEKQRKKVIGFVLIASLIFLIIDHPLEREYTFDQDTKELFSYIKTATPSDAIILTPPLMLSFRLKTDRAIVVDRIHPYTDQGVIEWFARISAVSNKKNLDPQRDRIEEVTNGYDTLEEDDLLHIKERYNVSYAVFESSKQTRKLSFPMSFQNKEYIVYQIEV
ncbi:hypothetical protein J4210_03370 [Candidatus Woesearchaeota archaeon]|nr:hypothetical protein [Candidatus Woesearchaeota archaeon]